jgi:hypothetical protein
MFFLNITRILQNTYGTFSVLAHGENPIGNILEPIAPIPAGHYLAKFTWHPKHGNCYELQFVPFHVGILIHAGNTIKDTQGCLLPGKQIDKIWGGIFKPLAWTWGVSQSKVMLAEILDIAKGADFSITIKENYLNQAPLLT